MNRMSRLTRKFIISLSFVFAAVVLLSLFLNEHFIQRYFLYQEKQEMRRICGLLEDYDGPVDEAAAELQSAEDVVIAWVQSTEDNALLNDRLRESFRNKGISLKKYWLWDQDQQDAMADGRKMRIYNQEGLHYSLLVVYMPVDSYFVAVSKIIPSIDRTMSLINQMTVAVFAGALVIMFLLISVLVQKIISPLRTIGEAAESISALDYKTVEIHTGDELEDLAGAINNMSMKLKEAHESLELKNQQMKELLANVSHDLKTPVALIKAYAGGIKDGLDDGTFLDTIIQQNNRMEKMIERLLDLAKMQRQQAVKKPVDISRRLADLIRDYRLQEECSRVRFGCEAEEGLTVMGDEEAVVMILSNLLSNAVKYTEDKQVFVSLHKAENCVILRVENRVNDPRQIDLQQIWEPFVVAEKSRNKAVSGTGLGLAIVKAAAVQSGFRCECGLENDRIIFTVEFPLQFG